MATRVPGSSWLRTPSGSKTSVAPARRRTTWTSRRTSDASRIGLLGPPAAEGQAPVEPVAVPDDGVELLPVVPDDEVEVPPVQSSEPLPFALSRMSEAQLRICS